MLAGEPRLAYQPVVDLMSGQLLGFEGLLRWDHPTEGVIPPQLLVPLAEANGDIVALGEWVISEGCRRATEWPASVQLAVNCSIVQLKRGVARSVAVALDEAGLPPDRLTIEVTERALSDDAAVAELRIITKLGVQLAVDDVGTSWNSFELLRRLAVNTVKIDESFVNGLEAREGINRMVVETVVQLAHNSGMATVAEGVETALHAAIVREFESDAAQGYFFSPPLSATSATKVANLPDLRFPLNGPGWQHDDGWPFDGIEAEDGGSRGTPPPRQRARINPAATGPTPDLDAIDLVEMLLERPHEPAPPSPATNGAPATNGNANGTAAKSNGAAKTPAARSGGAKPAGAKAPAPKGAPASGAAGRAGTKPSRAKATHPDGSTSAGTPAKAKPARRPPRGGRPGA